MSQRIRILTRVMFTWEDASHHGMMRQATREAFEATERPLTSGSVCGWLMTEDKKSITVAMDHFYVCGEDGNVTDEFRTICSYPKSGIHWQRREKVKVRMP